ncbi:MAG: cell wall-active antibiotics response protein [Bacteroidales bacterium]|nr:cell wall-active antibiotics response protein [Bacteroidales bacterium]
MNSIKNKLGLIIFALLVIAAGVLLFSFYIDLLPVAAKPIIFSWQTLLIAIGVVSLFQANHRIVGVILITVGAVFLLPKIDVPALAIFQEKGRMLCCALLLILLGLFFLIKVIFGKPLFGPFGRQKACTRTSTNQTGYIERNYVFGGGEEILDAHNFKGGEINCLFGGAEIDLSQAQMAEGTHTLSINIIFGGATIFVPSHWKVELRPRCIFGGFEDKRRPSTFDADDNKILIITFEAVFGGGEIRTR